MTTMVLAEEDKPPVPLNIKNNGKIRYQSKVLAVENHARQ